MMEEIGEVFVPPCPECGEDDTCWTAIVEDDVKCLCLGCKHTWWAPFAWADEGIPPPHPSRGDSNQLKEVLREALNEAEDQS